MGDYSGDDDDAPHANSGRDGAQNAIALEEEYDPPESSVSSPTSMAKSPTDGSSSAVSPSQDEASSPDVSSRRPSSAKSTASDKEKRKRSRVTPDQLVHLERFFSVDRSPTAARRREISDMLGMQERQTQIWFQNRRAKAKLLDGKSKGRAEVTPPNSPPELRPGYDASLHNLIHENDPVTIIPCSDLTIGTWRRISTSLAKHDLVAYVCENRRCLVWFIHSSGYGFKMEIPFDIIVETEFTNAAPGSGLASFFLSQPPTFYLEDVAPANGHGPAVRSWKRCADWTEGMQATKILRHDLIGSAVQLAHVLRNFQATSSADIRLRSPSYNMRPEQSPALSVEAMPRTLANEAQGWSERPDVLSALDSRKRASFTGQPLVLHPAPNSVDYSVVEDQSHPSHPSQHPSPAPSAYQPYSHMSSASSTSSTYSSTPLYPSEVPDAHHHRQQHPHMMEYTGMSGPQRMYTPQGYPMPQSAPASHSQFGVAPTPSPPILTTPFHSRSELNGMHSSVGIGGHGGGPLLSAPPIMHYDDGLDDRR
ncbi:homeobox-domain-containing protein [Artomyces pyxidatus]|uniref:Homeobox-domain-containing protein n=1 Tax=Artomyces pyxidatus TaxID=48021 RepID=A0ACB8SSI2_9AGAM|nr:homeobox-domain-containing protein [Artomyces pyxidatus]